MTASKIEKVLSTFEKLPTEVVHNILKFLPESKHRRNLAHTSTFFKKRVSIDYLVDNVLEGVVAGDQDKVQRLLEKRPYLAKARGWVTDWIGRVFYCSPLEYATWALDVRYMCPMIVSCLPENKIGEEIRLVLLAQFKAIQRNGLSFRFNDDRHQEQHFKFAPVIEAMLRFTRAYANLSESERISCWFAIGKLQNELPMHVRQHICDPSVSFDPIPTFQEPTFKRLLTFFSYVEGESKDWDNDLKGLGETFSMWRGSMEECLGLDADVPNTGEIDPEAMAALEHARVTIDLPCLEELLSTPIIKSDEPFNFSTMN